MRLSFGIENFLARLREFYCPQPLRPRQPVSRLIVGALLITVGLFGLAAQVSAQSVASVSAGGSHTMFILSDGTLWGTGANSSGQLTDAGARENIYSPIQAILGRGVRAVSAGEHHTMFLQSDGKLFATGLNQFGQLGNGTNITPAPAGIPPELVAGGVASVAAGGWHTMFIKTDGTLWGMGANFYGELSGVVGDVGSYTPIQVATGVASVAAGSGHTMFIKTDGTLWATGANVFGQLGDGTTTNRVAPVQVASGVACVSAGGQHTLFIKTDGTLWAMGNNAEGQLGDGTTTDRLAPVQVASAVASVSSGGNHTMFVKIDGTLWAMGSNSFGQLGDGTAINRSIPVQVASGVVSVSAGKSHTVFVRTGGILWAMGANEFGQLGNGDIPLGINWLSPVKMASDVTAVSAHGRHSRVVLSDGTLWGMGDSLRTSGILMSDDLTIAIPFVEISAYGPALIQLGSNVGKVSAGAGHTMFIKGDRTLWAIGDNYSGQLGDGTTTTQSVPEQVASGVSAISTGTLHTEFVKTDGTLWATGWNFYGQLGDGTATERHIAVQVASGVASVSCGNLHTMFVKSDGTLWATGWNNWGQLGDGTTVSRYSPVQVASGVASVSAGPAYTMFVKTDGTLWAMGYNSSGQLGDGTTTDRHIPVQVASGVSSVWAGEGHTVFVKTDGSLWAMGSNSSGQLGDGTTTDRLTAVMVASGVAAVATGEAHTVFVKVDGTLWGMGRNFYGQLGIPPTTNRSEPVLVNMFPSITTQPASLAVTLGSPATFIAAASGTPAPTYQWILNGESVPGATSASYTISAVSASDVGHYWVRALNSSGGVESNIVLLAVSPVGGGNVPAGFDLAGYLARYPDVAAVFGSDSYGAWLYYRDFGIYQGEVFDENFRVEEYLTLYPELFAIFGGDLGAALDHWLSTGRIEGRLGRVPLEFSVGGYFTRNPDVATAVNFDPILAWGHYWLYGIYEGRAYDDELRVFEYVAINADLTAAFVNDWRTAALHWMRYGRTEGRLGRLPLTFSVATYLSRNPDVAAVWGTDPTTVFLHFWLYGINEARTYDDLFRVDDYLALNPDLAATFGTDRRGAFKHWVRYGQSEGRPGKNP